MTSNNNHNDNINNNNQRMIDDLNDPNIKKLYENVARNDPIWFETYIIITWTKT